MRKLTCYAWGKPGDWEALCVDLDLAAQGGNFAEVRRELSDAVETYLDYITDLPESEQPAFLNRKAPLTLRWRLALTSKIPRALSVAKLTSGGDGVTRARFAVTPNP